MPDSANHAPATDDRPAPVVEFHPHQPLMDALLGELAREWAFWRREAWAADFAWHLLAAIGIVCGACRALAHNMLPTQFQSDVQIGVTVVAAAATAFFTKFAFGDRRRIAKTGDIEFQKLLCLARSARASSTTEEAFRAAFIKTVEARAKLQRELAGLDPLGQGRRRQAGERASAVGP